MSELWLYAAYAWFPAIWCLAASGLIGDDSTNNLYFIGDTMGKLLYTAALLIINFEIIDVQEQLHRVQYEAEMRIQMINEKMRSQEDSRRQALLSNERKREFLRYILHEIRVPLNALVLGLEGLKQSVDSSSSSQDSGPHASRDSAAHTAHTAHRTPILSGRVQEEDGEEEEDTLGMEAEEVDDAREAGGAAGVRLSMGEAVMPSSSPNRSPLPSPTLERSPLLFSNSSILPSTTSLSRASSLALSAVSSASSHSAGHASPLAVEIGLLSTSSSSSPSTSPSAVTLCAEDADSINEMWHAVSHMTRLLDDVLSLQRIEDGELLLERRAFSLQDTCVGAVRMMATWLENKELSVRCDVDSSLPIVVSDEYRVRQVLINFLSNAIRFTPGKDDNGSDGRIVLTVKRCERFDDYEPIIQEGHSAMMEAHTDDRSRANDRLQHIQPDKHDHNNDNNSNIHSAEFLAPLPLSHQSASLSSNPPSSPVASPAQPAASLSGSPPSSPARLFIRVSVHDSGIGIPLSDLQRMFTPFVQISSGEAEKGKGTGLGLSICRKLIDLLGGRVGVISEPGKGSTFFFEAPFEVSADQNRSALRPADALLSASGAINAEEASSRTINKPSTVDSEPKPASPQLITSSLRSKRRAMHNKQKSSSDVNSIPLHPAHPSSLTLAANSQHSINAPSSPVRMVARALTVPPPTQQPPALPSPSLASAVTAAAAAAPASPATTAVADDAAAAAAGGPTAASLSTTAISHSSRVRHPSAGRRRPPLRVLVVDDADSNRKLLARLVSKDGAAVCEQARDGQEAVNMLVDDVGRFDCILCDKVSLKHTINQRTVSAALQTVRLYVSSPLSLLLAPMTRRCPCSTATGRSGRCAVWEWCVPSSE